MNKKHGFTLIELLAVIVVLAIIALIATPIVMNTIKRSKKGAAERSADSYVKQVEVAVATERLNKNEVLDGEYQITNDGNLCRDKSASCSDDKKIKIEMNGTKPTSGKIKITNGSVDQSSSNMTIGDYDVTYNSTKKAYEATEKGNSATTTVYRWSSDPINIGDTIDPNNYTKDANKLGKSYYLKHILDKDNKVTESYVCAIFNSKEYCLRGGKSSFYGYTENEVDYTGNALILKELRDEKIAGISCNFSSNQSYCGVAPVYLYAYSSGSVSPIGDDGYCGVGDDGSSFCESI